MNEKITGIPAGRILEKLDAYLDRKDFDGAARLLTYWYAEACSLGDGRGALAMANERIGLFRKTEKRDEAMRAVADALGLLDSLGLGDETVAGTTYINAATAYKAFGEAETALPLYERARGIYERKLSPADPRLGGLYNNMALAVAELGDFTRARALYDRALAVMARTPGGEPEMAVTCCNLADLETAEAGIEAAETAVTAWLERAMALLDTPGLARDGHYAFVCEKCAPTFDYYGFFLYGQELAARARAFYEGT